MKTLRHFSYEEIISYIPEKPNNSKIIIDNYTFKTGSDRLVLFKKNNKCVCCNLIGNKFLLQIEDNHYSPHLNLYNDDILFTKDHILPKKLGGKDHISNYQTLCLVCNQLKAHYLVKLNTLKEAKKMLDENVSKLSIENYLINNQL